MSTPTATIVTNHVPRLLLDGNELTAAERVELDYVDWDAIDAGTDSGTFFRYRGQIYDFGEFLSASGMFGDAWDGYASDTYFSGILVKLVENDNDRVIVARFMV